MHSPRLQAESSPAWHHWPLCEFYCKWQRILVIGCVTMTFAAWHELAVTWVYDMQSNKILLCWHASSHFPLRKKKTPLLQRTHVNCKRNFLRSDFVDHYVSFIKPSRELKDLNNISFHFLLFCSLFPLHAGICNTTKFHLLTVGHSSDWPLWPQCVLISFQYCKWCQFCSLDIYSEVAIFSPQKFVFQRSDIH